MSQETLKTAREPMPAGMRAPAFTTNRPHSFATRSQASSLVRRLTAPSVRLLDQIAMTAALVLTLFSFALEQGENTQNFLQLRISARNLFIEIGFLIVWRCMFWVAGLYQPRLHRSLGTFLWKIPTTVFFCSSALVTFLSFTRQKVDLFQSGFVFWFTGSALMLSTRIAVYTYEERIRPMLRRRRTVLICGTGMRARLLAMQLPAHRDFRYQLAGFIDSTPQPDCLRLAPILGGVADLESILMRLPVDEVMVALPIKSHFAEIEEILSVCGRAGIQTQYSVELFTSEIAKHHTVDEAEGTRMVVKMVHQDHRLILKSIVDRAVSVLCLTLLSPIMLAIALGIKLSSKGPVFFVQQRYGMGKRKFGMIKFRSMVVDAEAKQAALEHLNEHDGPTFKIRRDPRVTPFGIFLRRSSLDELPQLFNVLLGEMSLVGPRPLPSRDVERFSEAWLMRRFSVKPGITGLWQVSGRSNTDFDHAIRLDLRYIDRWSLLLDIKILLRTFAAVARGRGAY